MLLNGEQHPRRVKNENDCLFLEFYAHLTVAQLLQTEDAFFSAALLLFVFTAFFVDPG